jgi:hypothetical protein
MKIFYSPAIEEKVNKCRMFDNFELVGVRLGVKRFAFTFSSILLGSAEYYFTAARLLFAFK